MQFLLSASDILRDIGASLCKLIYWLIANLYELFINVSSVRFLNDDNIMPIYQRVTLILSIIMVFYVTFQAVKYVIQPDTMSDKEKGAGKVVQRMIIVILLIAMVPQIFSFAYTLQNSLLKNQIFSKVILGKQSVSVATYGRSFSANIFGMFYYVDEEYWKEDFPDIIDLECDDVPCKTLVDTNLSTLANTGHLTYLDIGLNEKEDHTDESGEEIEVYGITFQGWLAIAVGLFICYMLVLYCIDAGTRVAQLAFLQIIAPIPIIGYLAPKKDGIFEKWTKQCLTTYIDLFLRMAVIYVVLLLIEILGEAYRTNTLLNGLGKISSEMKFFIYIALIVGLLAFAKRAPKMLQELFPKMGAASGSLGLSWKDRTAAVTDLAKGANKLRKSATKYTGYGRRAVGGAAGFVAGAIAGRSLRAASQGAKKGFDKNNKGLLKGSIFNRARQAANAGRQVRENRQDVIDNGGTAWGSEHRQEHYKNVAQKQDRLVNNLENIKKKKDNINSSIGEIKALKQLEIMKAAANSAGNNAEALRLDKEIKKVQKAARAYAVERNTSNMTQLKDAITDAARGTALETELTTDPNYMDSIVEKDSAKWDSVKAAYDSRKTILTPEVIETIGEKTIMVKDATTGRDVPKAIKDLTDEEIAKYVGDIADVATSVAANEKNSDEYKRAHANAQGSKNSSGK